MGLPIYKKDLIDIFSNTFTHDRLIVDEEFIECYTEVFFDTLNRNLKIALQSKKEIFHINKYDLFYHYRVFWNYKVPNITFDAQNNLYLKVLPFIKDTLNELNIEYSTDTFTDNIIFQVRDLKDLVKSNDNFIMSDI